MCQFRLISISAASNIQEYIKKVSCESNTVYRLNPLSIFHEKSLYSNRNISTDRIATRLTFELGDEQTFTVLRTQLLQTKLAGWPDKIV